MILSNCCIPFVNEHHQCVTELQGLMSSSQRLEPPPSQIPTPARPWSTDDLHVSTTTSFGKINFENVEHVGGKKPAKVNNNNY